MALIKCSFCEREVSDKAKICPGCGQILNTETENNSEKILLCKECGREVSSDMATCFYCGCPIQEEENETPQKVEITSVKLPITKKFTKKHIIVITVVFVLIIGSIIVGSIVKSHQLAQASADYYANLQRATRFMLVGAAEAEDAGNLIKSVWYNTIYEERDSETDKYTRDGYLFYDDFNDSLANLFSDTEFKNQLLEIENSQEEVSSIMRELQNPPEEYQEAYIAIKELYDAYIELTEMALNPSGSLTTYSSNFNNADSEFVNCYKAMDLYVEQ